MWWVKGEWNGKAAWWGPFETEEDAEDVAEYTGGEITQSREEPAG